MFRKFNKYFYIYFYLFNLTHELSIIFYNFQNIIHSSILYMIYASIQSLISVILCLIYYSYKILLQLTILC